MAARFGGALHAAGIERGDHVAAMCGNRTELLQVYLGCGWIGAVTVPINTASRGAQLAHILANSQAKLLVLQAEFAAAVDSLEIALPSLRAVWLIGDADLAERWPRPARFPAPAEPVPEAAIGPGDTVAILYTSGTTGVVEGRMLPARSVFLVGREYGATTGAARGRCAAHHPAAVSHQCAQHLLSGSAYRRRAGCGAALLRLGLRRIALPPWRQRHLPARRDGADPAIAPGQ